MPVIDYIDCKRKRSTKFFPFTPFGFSKIKTTGDLAMFKDFNIVQMGLDKRDT